MLRKGEYSEMVSRSGEKLALSRVIDLGLSSLFTHEDVILPGRRSATPHFHSRVDELVIVLEGQLVAVDGHQRTMLGPGDVFGFPAGTGRSHTLVNESRTDSARVVMVASVCSADVVSYGK